MVEACGKLILPLRRAKRIFHNGADRTHVKLHRFLPFHKALYKPGNFPDIFFRSRHFIIKIRLDFEKFIKLIVILAQRFIVIITANHNNLDIGSNGFRLQRWRNDRSQLLPHRIHIDFLRLNYAAQGLPCLRCGKDILRLHDQVAAVCLMKQAALDFHEICCQVAKFAVILYFAHKIIVGRVKRHNNRRTLRF